MKANPSFEQQQAREWLEMKDDDYLESLRERLEAEKDGDQTPEGERARKAALALVWSILAKRNGTP